MRGTARKAETFIEPSLINSEIRYRSLSEAAQDGILLLHGRTGKNEDDNPNFIKKLDYSCNEFIKKKLLEFVAFTNVEASQDIFEVKQGNEYFDLKHKVNFLLGKFNLPARKPSP
jgi:PAS domain-containing protein